MGFLCLLSLTAILTMPIRAHLPDKEQEVNKSVPHSEKDLDLNPDLWSSEIASISS